MKLPSLINVDKASVIEIETDELGIAKIVYRMPIDEERDISLAIIPGQQWKVKTVWGEMKTDNHRTLNKRRYAKR